MADPDPDPDQEKLTGLLVEADYLAALIQSSKDAIISKTPAGIVTSWNDAAAALFGYQADEIIGKPVVILFSPDRLRDEDVILERISRGERIEQHATTRRHKDGRDIRVSLAIAPIRDLNGRIIGASKIARDISRRVDAAEAALARSEQRFRRVIEATPTALITVRQTGTIEMVNTQAERMFGYARHELLGQSIDMLVPERFRGSHPQQRNGYFGEPRSRSMGDGRELYGLRKDGGEFPVEIGLNSLETDDGPMILSSIIDISERKYRELKIRAALKEKELLLGEIHHRVKNNLQVIHSLLGLQASSGLDPAMRELLNESQSRIRSMALIHQTLYESKDFARVDFRRFLLSLVPTLVASYAVHAGRIKVLVNAAEVSLPIEAAIPCALIVNELVANALKHGFPEPMSGTIWIDFKQADAHRLELSVSDDGVGLPAAPGSGSKTLGLELVRLLADQVAADLSIQPRNPTRLALSLRAPP
jgi:PAS domain S-box-containing protein